MAEENASPDDAKSREYIAKLELRKLQLECTQLELSWWKKPSYIGAVGTLLIAATTLTSLWWSGYFNSERQELVNQVDALQLRLEQSQDQRDQALEMIRALERVRENLISRLSTDSILSSTQLVGNIPIEISDITPSEWDMWNHYMYVPKIDSLLRQY